MPRLSNEQVAELRQLAGLRADDTSDVDTLFAAAAGRLRARRRVDPHRRDRVIMAAVSAGKFSLDRAGFYLDAYQRDPDGTEALIGQMAGVRLPEADTGAGYGQGGLDELEAALYPPARERVWAEQDAEAERIDAELRQTEIEAAAGGLTEAEYLALFGPDEVRRHPSPFLRVRVVGGRVCARQARPPTNHKPWGSTSDFPG